MGGLLIIVTKFPFLSFCLFSSPAFYFVMLALFCTWEAVDLGFLLSLFSGILKVPLAFYTSRVVPCTVSKGQGGLYD